MRTIIVCLSVFTGFVSCAKLPPIFKKCDSRQEDFDKCLVEAVENAMGQLTQPLKKFGLPSLDPLEVESLQIRAGTNAVGLQQNFKDVKIYGITNTKCLKMKFDFQKKTIDNLCIYPQIRMESKYDINGKILILDIHGSGPGTITLENVTIPVQYKFEEYLKSGKKHFKITHIDLKMQPEKVQFNFQNLFGGNTQLSENVHQVVNENWKEVYDDVRSSYDEVFGKITLGIFNALLDRVPAAELIGEE